MFSRFKKKKRNFPTKDEFDKLEERVINHHIYLNNIFVFHDLEMTPYLELMRSISYELLKFFDNICAKYEIEYWLDFGTLLGAVRHGDFIPWDDDLDVGMLRADYYKFLEVFPKELEKANLKYVVTQFKQNIGVEGSIRWYQINCKKPDFNGKFVGIDVFPYDFITDFDDNYIHRFHNDVRPKFFKTWNGEIDTLKDAIDDVCVDLSLSLDKTDYFIGGVDGGRFYIVSPFKILKTEDLIPFKRMKFGKYDFLAPNNPNSYLSEIYGNDFMIIGKSNKDHGRLNRYKKYPDISEILTDVEIELIEANDKFI